MDYFWRENKKFLIMLGAGGVFFLLYYNMVLGSMYADADKAARDLNMEIMNLQAKVAQGVPTGETLSLAERTRDRSKKQLAGMAADCQFVVGDRFKPPKGERALPYFENLNLDLFRELQKKSVKATIKFPQGFGLVDQASEESAAEMLLRLAIVDRLVNEAVKAGGIKEIGHLDALYQADRMDTPITVKGQFLNSYSVLMRFSGESEGVFKVLHGLQKKGNYLAVTHFEAMKPDPTADRLEAAIGVTVLRIAPDAPIEAPRGGEFDEDDY